MKLRFLLLSLLLVTILQQAVAQINDDELYNKAVAYYEAKQYDMAVPIFEQLACKDHAKACNALGIIYCNGIIGSPDYQRGYDYLKQSADLGFDLAMINLGDRFYFSEDYPGFYQWWGEKYGFGTHSEQAAKWYIMAAKGNGSMASDGYYGLSFMCFFPNCDGESWGYCRDGLPYLQTAAQMGNPQAMVAMGIESAPQEAIEWLEKAKANGIKNVIWWAGIGSDVSITDLMVVQNFCLESKKWRILSQIDCSGSFHTVKHSGNNLIAYLSNKSLLPDDSDYKDYKYLLSVFSSDGKLLYTFDSSQYELDDFNVYYVEDKNAWHFETFDGNIEWLDLSGKEPRVVAVEKKNY